VSSRLCILFVTDFAPSVRAGDACGEVLVYGLPSLSTVRTMDRSVLDWIQTLTRMYRFDQ